MSDDANLRHHQVPEGPTPWANTLEEFTGDWSKRPFQFGLPGSFVSKTGLLPHILRLGTNALIKAPTGSGKSWETIRYLLRNRIPFVYVADTKVVADDLSSRHKIPAVYERRKAPEHGHSFITIPDHAPKYTRRDLVLIVDEWHGLALERGFRQGTMEDLANTFAGWRQVVGISATPTFTLPGFDRYSLIWMPEPRTIYLENDSSLNLRSRLSSHIANNADRKHWVTLFSKDAALSGLTNALGKAGILPGEILLLNSETRGNEQCLEMLNANEVPEGIRVVISTYRQGFSIDEGVFDVHLMSDPGQLSDVDIVQFLGRFRRPGASINTAWLYATLKAEKADFDAGRLADHWRREANGRLSTYLQRLGIEKPNAKQKRIIYLAETSRLPLHAGGTNFLLDPELGPNELTIAYEVHKVRTAWLYAHPLHLKSALGELCIKLVDADSTQPNRTKAKEIAHACKLPDRSRRKLEDILLVISPARLEQILQSQRAVTPKLIGAIYTRALALREGSEAATIRLALASALKVGERLNLTAFKDRIDKAADGLSLEASSELRRIKEVLRSVNRFIYVKRARLLTVVSYDPLDAYSG